MSLSDEFAILLLLISGISAGIVLPPTNVTVSCQNVRVSVHWDYRTEEPQTIFRGNVEPWNCTFETTDHEYDLSNCIWKSPEEKYLSFMYVSIAAVQGAIQSEPKKSNTFSFNKIKTVDTKCSLEFPLAEIQAMAKQAIQAKELMATVSFQNPFYFYKEMTQQNMDGNTILFTVSPAEKEPAQGVFEASCTTERICKRNVSFHKGVKKCVTLSGMLLVGPVGAKQVEFRKTPEICASETPPDFSEMMLAAVLSSLLLSVVIVLITCICKMRAWTFDPSVPLPPFLKGSGGDQNKHPPKPPKTHISLISVESNRCHVSEQTVLFNDVDHPKDTHDSADNSSAGSDYKPRNCCYTERPHLDSSGTDDDSGDDSVKTECVSIEERSAYDCPHLMVDMGDGDMVTGYTGN